MSNKKLAILAACLITAACASDQPRVIQTSSGAANIDLTAGLATQVELPANERVQSVVVGNTDLVSTSQDGDVINLAAKAGAGDTNMIVRATDEDGDAKVYQYRITVQAH